MKENKTKASIRIPEKNQVDLQALQFGRGSSLNLKTVFPTMCNTTRQLHAYNWSTKTFTKNNFYLMALFIQYDSTVLFLDVLVRIVVPTMCNTTRQLHA